MCGDNCKMTSDIVEESTQSEKDGDCGLVGSCL